MSSVGLRSVPAAWGAALVAVAVGPVAVAVELTAAQLRVPLVVWTSPPWRRRHADDWAAVRANRSRPVSTAAVFDGLASLLDLGFTGREDRRSPFSAAFEAPPRYVLLPDQRPAQVRERP